MMHLGRPWHEKVRDCCIVELPIMSARALISFTTNNGILSYIYKIKIWSYSKLKSLNKSPVRVKVRIRMAYGVLSHYKRKKKDSQFLMHLPPPKKKHLRLVRQRKEGINGIKRDTSIKTFQDCNNITCQTWSFKPCTYWDSKYILQWLGVQTSSTGRYLAYNIYICIIFNI